MRIGGSSGRTGNNRREDFLECARRDEGQSHFEESTDEGGSFVDTISERSWRKTE
jgi:hypothetical protein